MRRIFVALTVLCVCGSSPHGTAQTGRIDGYWNLTAEFADFDLSTVVRFETAADGRTVKGIVLGPTAGRNGGFVGTLSASQLSVTFPGPFGEAHAELALSDDALSGKWTASGLSGDVRGTRKASRKPEPEYYPKYFGLVCRLLRDRFFDPRLNGVDLETASAAYATHLPGVKDDADFVALVRRFLSEFGTSHMNFYVAPESAPVREKTPLVISRRLSPDISYLRIRHFDPPLARDRETFTQAIERALGDATGSSLIVDVRGNRGGDIGLVFHTLGRLLAPGQKAAYGYSRSGASRLSAPANAAGSTSVNAESELPVLSSASTSMIGDIVRHGAALIRIAPGETTRYRGSIAVLVDERCFSGCELFSAILQEMGRAVVFGTRTGGEVLGSHTETIVKNMVIMKKDTGWRVEIPIVDFRTPGGERLEGRGVIPDVEVRAGGDGDAVLAEAVRYLARANRSSHSEGGNQ